uniref:Uncharacterized protein n=1 Tax=Globodera rostochiensis TaxID=31243 RepID=A0A914H561_GLORO
MTILAKILFSFYLNNFICQCAAVISSRALARTSKASTPLNKDDVERLRRIVLGDGESKIDDFASSKATIDGREEVVINRWHHFQFQNEETPRSVMLLCLRAGGSKQKKEEEWHKTEAKRCHQNCPQNGEHKSVIGRRWRKRQQFRQRKSRTNIGVLISRRILSIFSNTMLKTNEIRQIMVNDARNSPNSWTKWRRLLIIRLKRRRSAAFSLPIGGTKLR